MTARRLLPFLACLAFVLPPACRKAPPDKRYPVKGTVTEIDRPGKLITLDHDDIPGYMPAMIMPFPVEDPTLLDVARPGDEVTAALVITGDNRYWLQDIVVSRRVPDAERPSARPTAREPRPGEALPDVSLVNQDGRTVRLADYRGRALALTFIFTRCPLPDFCPLMTRSFAAVARSLAADPALQARTHLLSVSFDTAYDTPEVLRRYGTPFAGAGPRPFAHWEFVSGAPDQVRTLWEFLGLEVEEDGGQFVHNLRTAVVAPDGTLVRSIRGSDWRPEDVVADLRAAVDRAAAARP